MSLEKLEECPRCGKVLRQGEYDFQCCTTCKTLMGFELPEEVALEVLYRTLKAVDSKTLERCLMKAILEDYVIGTA